jgi:predicted RND superfamily exporter protein
MKAVGLGLNVNTLPVSALGVGIGVDYGIYFYSRLMEERKKHSHFGEAARETLQTTGAAVLYTALTLSAGVLTWLLSDLKFQADMGLLLGFIYIANMVGAMVLLPALVFLSRGGGGAARQDRLRGRPSSRTYALQRVLSGA